MGWLGRIKYNLARCHRSNSKTFLHIASSRLAALRRRTSLPTIPCAHPPRMRSVCFPPRPCASSITCGRSAARHVAPGAAAKAPSFLSPLSLHGSSFVLLPRRFCRRMSENDDIEVDSDVRGFSFLSPQWTGPKATLKILAVWSS